jgi:hypothetical protein
MDRNYPTSDFLKMVANDEVIFEGKFGATNLSRLIELLKDEDRSNRD